jgi:hypothetical protein
MAPSIGFERASLASVKHVDLSERGIKSPVFAFGA